MTIAPPLAGAAPPSEADQEVAWEWLETPRFRFAYHPQQQAQAAWYGAFVERVYDELTALLGVSLTQTAVVRLYPTDAAYVADNPAAAGSRHILAHARPGTVEIGMALTRLERLDGEARVDALRHELAHLLLTQRAGGRLPVGWHEGLAQLLERDRSSQPQVVALLRRADGEQRLLAWDAFTEPERFYAQAPVAYPESLAAATYLADRYGFGRFLVFLDALRDGADVSAGLPAAFGSSAAGLEAAWRAALPEMLAGAWPADPLAARDLEPARAALRGSRLAEAADLAGRSERFWADLGQADRRDEARAIRLQAEARLALGARLEEGRRLVAAFEFDLAAGQLAETVRMADAQADAERRATAEALQAMAQRGRAGAEALRVAREALARRGYPEAQVQALVARQAYLDAGDVARAAEALAVRDQAAAEQQRMALGLGAAGLVALVGSAIVGLGVRRARQPGGRRPAPPTLAEERLAL